MAGNISNGSQENDSGEETSPKTGLSTSFTISFEDDDDRLALKQKKIKSTNMFVRRHVRTLSLPLNDCLVNKSDAKSSGNVEKRNHVGFSNQKNATHPISKEIEKVTMAKEYIEKNTRLESTESDDCFKKNGSINDVISDSESEGGTYTLDKDNKEVQIARKTIDQVFGISPSPNTGQDNIFETNEKMKNKTRMIDEWIESSATAVRISSDVPKTQSVTMNSCFKKSYVSKIPSPVFIRRELNLKEPANSGKKMQSASVVKSKHVGAVESQVFENPMNSPTNGDIDTESYLKETENIVVALQNRLHSDAKPFDEPEKESPASKYSNTRLNRAFSLRRDRLNKPSPVINSTAIPIRAKSTQGKQISSSRMSEINGYAHTSSDVKTSKSKELNRLKNGITSTSASKMREHSRAEDLKKKTYQRLKPAGGGLRSNSSLSAQEIEFQNWKRRKSYDPLKAAAEDRKKKSMMQSAAGSASVSTAALTKKPKSTDQNENEDMTEKGIMRSASFHGLRNKNGYDRSVFPHDDVINRSASSRFISSSCHSNANSNSSDIADNDDEDDWTVPKPPSTSLQNTPPESVSSRLSLLSHAMSSSSVLLISSPNSKVNFMTLLNVSQLTREILTAVSTMADPLKCDSENLNQDSESHFRNQNGVSSHTSDYQVELNNPSGSLEEENTYCADDNFDEEDDEDTGNDESKSNELSGNYLLNVTLDNLKQIKDAVQNLQLVYSNK